MRALLVAGPSTAGQPPLGVLSLATITARHGCDVEVVELPTRVGVRDLIARASGADVIGFTTTCGIYPRVLTTVAAVRAALPGACIVLGGPQATTTAKATLDAWPAIDLILRGEAEESWPLVLDALSTGTRDWRQVPGAIWCDEEHALGSGPPETMPDIETVPLPDYRHAADFVQPSYIPVEVGRGCPYGCTFCSTNSFFKRRFRMKSVTRILADLTALQQTYQVRHFDFIHDMFTVRRDYVEKICAALAQTGVSWNCSARTDRLDDELVAAMVRSGCRGIYVGLETGSQRLQREVRKNLDIYAAVSRIRSCQTMGLGITASLIYGYPDEHISDLRDTLLCYFELSTPHPSGSVMAQVTPQLHLFAPLAGTPIVSDPADFAYDGYISSTVRTDFPDGIGADESRLIADSFALFSAFFHPLRTEYARNDYIALDTLFEILPRLPRVMSHIARRARLDFVAFLLAGRLGVAPDRPNALNAALAVLDRYVAARPHDTGIRRALRDDLDEMMMRRDAAMEAPRHAQAC